MGTRWGTRFLGTFLFPFLCAGLLLLPNRGYSAQDLVEMQKNPGQWVVSGKNYSLTRYSELNQITTANAKNLKVAWTFSTGVLRGHEGAHMAVGDTMHLVT